MGDDKGLRPGRGRRAIAYHIVVDGTPSPDMLVENYIWCLKQREMAAGGGANAARPISRERSQGFNI